LISIIVTNYSYSYLLPLVMQSYNRMTKPPCDVEMIIVDDSSDPDDYFEELVYIGLDRIKPWYEVRVYKIPLSCSKMNIGRTINVGVKQSEGDILIFNHADLIHLAKETLNVVHDFHANVKEPDMHLLFPTFVNTKPEYFGTIHNLTNPAGASMPRKLFDELGGFDETFDGYGHEDADFYWRLHYANERGEKPHWKHTEDSRLVVQHMSLCAIGMKRSIYPNPHNEARVNHNSAHQVSTVNLGGWGECEGLEEIIL